tara:strand:- start:368 stop:613 length:246 start_codon:yes stop_codon:yes gene_type:complete
MNEPRELSENVWLDELTKTIVLGIDRFSIAFDAQEFWNFCLSIEEAKHSLENHSDFIIGTYEEDGVEKTELIVRELEDDFN